MILFELIGAALMQREFAGYAPKAQRAVVRALNRGIAAGHTFMASQTAKDVGIKVRDVKKAIRVHTASAAKPEARLATSLRRISLMKFGATGPTPSRGRGRGVRYRIGRMGRKTLPHAFIATMKNGHVGVLQRFDAGGNRGARGPRGGKTKALFGPSLGHIFARYRNGGLARAYAQFAKTLDHELSRLRPSGGAE
jgi:hypothetical protein